MIVMVLPKIDFDPTESSVPWQYLTAAGHEVLFATPDGEPAAADPRLVDIGFGIANSLFMTKKEDITTYKLMANSARFRSPLSYADLDANQVSAVLVPGGHAKGMREMIESPVLQSFMISMFKANKPVAAICHGVLLLARSLDENGQSVLYGRETTALPSVFEWPAWKLTQPWLKDYYRTYSTSVQSEVQSVLKRKSDFKVGPIWPIRDTTSQWQRGFIVEDDNYISARWPGDVHRYARAICDKVKGL